MLSFAMKIKDELSSISLSEKEKRSILMGLLQVNASINFSSNGLYLEFKSKNEKVSDLVYNLIIELFKLEPFFLSTKETKLNKEEIFIVKLEQNAFFVLNELKILQAKDDTTYQIKKELVTEEERVSYLRGAFLACGSVNDPSSNTYHLEIQTFSPNVCYGLRDLMNSFNIQAKITNNRRGYIVYLKSADKISDFLRLVGSTDSLFYFEDHRIEKDLANSINRVMNCEIANEKKSIDAARRQTEEIKVVMDYYKDRLKESLKEVCALRLNHKEESLNELSAYSLTEIGKSISKSALNHRFREIHVLYLEIMEKNS